MIVKSNNSISWGILGTGDIANQFLSSFPSHINGRVIAIASRSFNRAESLAKKYDIPLFYGDYTQLIQNPEVDIIYIATINHVHFDQAKNCLLAGKSVLCEKPLTIEFKKTNELIKVAKKKNLFLMEAMRTRFLPHIVKLKEMLREDHLKGVKFVQLNFGFKKNQNIERLFNNKFGGGALFDMGVYGVSIMLYLFGTPSDICAISDKQVNNDVDRLTVIIFKYSCGRIVKMSFSIGLNLPLHCYLVGSDFSIHLADKWWREPSLQINKSNSTENFESINFSNFSSYMIQHVNDCIENGLQESTEMSLSDSIETARIVEEIFSKI